MAKYVRIKGSLSTLAPYLVVKEDDKRYYFQNNFGFSDCAFKDAMDECQKPSKDSYEVFYEFVVAMAKSRGVSVKALIRRAGLSDNYLDRDRTYGPTLLKLKDLMVGINQLRPLSDAEKAQFIAIFIEDIS